MVFSFRFAHTASGPTGASAHADQIKASLRICKMKIVQLRSRAAGANLFISGARFRLAIAAGRRHTDAHV
jgi:hypothetical protein